MWTRDLSLVVASEKQQRRHSYHVTREALPLL